MTSTRAKSASAGPRHRRRIDRFNGCARRFETLAGGTTSGWADGATGSVVNVTVEVRVVRLPDESTAAKVTVVVPSRKNPGASLETRGLASAMSAARAASRKRAIAG